MIQSVREVQLLERYPETQFDFEGMQYVGERQFMVVTDGQSNDVKEIMSHKKIPKLNTAWDKKLHELKCFRVLVRQELGNVFRVRALYVGRPD